jgi:methanogenic corrinoid protein MtbC1
MKTALQEFLTSIIVGNRPMASQIMKQQHEELPDILDLYETLFKPSLYQVGTLWEYNKISVAEEHMATAVCEALMNELYPSIVSNIELDRKVIVTCAPNESHQLGAKMVADIFEKNKWNAKFLGANTPLTELIRYIEQEKPYCVGISLSVYFNMPMLLEMVKTIRRYFPQQRIFVGGQAFMHLHGNPPSELNGVPILKDLYELNKYIQTLNIK